MVRRRVDRESFLAVDAEVHTFYEEAVDARDTQPYRVNQFKEANMYSDDFDIIGRAFVRKLLEDGRITEEQIFSDNQQDRMLLADLYELLGLDPSPEFEVAPGLREQDVLVLGWSKYIHPLKAEGLFITSGAFLHTAYTSEKKRYKISDQRIYNFCHRLISHVDPQKSELLERVKVFWEEDWVKTYRRHMGNIAINHALVEDYVYGLCLKNTKCKDDNCGDRHVPGFDTEMQGVVSETLNKYYLRRLKHGHEQDDKSSNKPTLSATGSPGSNTGDYEFEW